MNTICRWSHVVACNSITVIVFLHWVLLKYLRYIFFLCRIFFVNCSFNSIVLVFFIKAKDLNSFSAIGLFSFQLCKSWCDLIRDDMTWYFIKCLVIKMLFFGVENTTFYMFDTRVPLINSFLYCTFIPLIKSG